MSVKAMNWAWDVPRLTTAQRVVLVKIADSADGQRFQAWPGVRFLAEKACLSERQVMRVIAQLEGLGLLTRQRWRGRDGRGKTRIDESTYLYTLQVTQRHLDLHAAPDNTSPGQIVAPDTGDMETLTPAQGDPDTGDTETLTSSRARADKEEPTTEPTTEPSAETAPAEPGPAAAPDGAAAPARREKRAAGPAKAHGLDYNRIMRGWNDVALELGRPQVSHLTDKRRAKLKLRFAERGWDWRRILAKVPEAPGALGFITFDWLIDNSTNALKLLEGNYDRTFGAPPPRVRPPDPDPEPPPPPKVLAACTECRAEITSNYLGIADAEACATCAAVMTREEFQRRREAGRARRLAAREGSHIDTTEARAG